MSDDRELLLLKGVATDIIEPIWKSEFYNDAEDYIIYKDPENKSNPKSEEEIEQIHSELNRIKEDLVDTIVEDLIEKNIKTIEDIRRDFSIVRDVCYKRFAEFRRRFWDVIRPRFTA